MDYKIIFYIAFVTILQIIELCNGQFYKSTPHPSYSLQNMPKTSFSCRDKILGGYYADPETECQMFHVCVKIAGVGVQDYRFLCPNGTAFDQEAQICGYFGDIDCQGATLYYGSDNFDLYRIGTTFESKRAPFAEENEADFHLQRAETGDARRSKQFIVNQNSRNNNKENYQNSDNFVQSSSTTNTPAPTTTIRYTTRRNQDEYSPTTQQFTNSYSNNYYNNDNNNKDNYFAKKQQFNNEKTPTKAPMTTTTTTTAKLIETQYNNYNNDEILRGSHSSDFFSNKNNGKETYDDEDARKSLPTKKPTQIKQGKQRVRQQIKYANSITPAPAQYNQYESIDQINNGITEQDHTRAKVFVATKQVNPSAPSPFQKRPKNAIVVEKRRKLVTQAPASRNSIQQQFNSFTDRSETGNNYAPTSRTTKLPTNNSNSNNAYFSQQQQNSQTSTANPIRNPFQRISTTATTESKSQYFEKSNYQNFQKTNDTSPRDSSNKFYNVAYEEKANEQPIVDFNRAEKRINSATSEFQRRTSQINRKSSIQTYDKQYIQSSTYNPYTIQTTSTAAIQNASPRVFPENPNAPTSSTTTSIRPIIYNNLITIAQDNITPQSVKKFSTLVPRDSYNPTTFKPNTYRKNDQNFDSYSGFSAIPQSSISQHFSSSTAKPETTTKRVIIRKTTTTLPNIGHRSEQQNFGFSVTPIVVKQNAYLPYTTPKELLEDEEDDGSYRPELYEKDFYRNKLRNSPRSRIAANSNNYKFQNGNEKAGNADYKNSRNNVNYYQSSSTTNSDEDLKPANSLNIAASVNELRKQNERQQMAGAKSKSEKTQSETSKPAQQQPSLKLTAVPHQGPSYIPTISPFATSTKKAPKKNEDDYNYEYYDIVGNDKSQSDYDGYDVIQEFAKTNSKRRT